MELGMIGLGRMGANMAQRLIRGGHRVVGFDPNQDVRKSLESKGLESVAALDALAGKLKAPRALWLMVPAGETVDKTIDALLPRLSPGDTIIDGGNSNYKDTMRRAQKLEAQKIHYVDCGTSGGVWGLAEGYSMMIGGDTAAVERLRPIFETLAPGKAQGWGRVGPAGSGHFTKMVHNGIEYGMMQAYAEGFSILKHKEDFGLDLHQIGPAMAAIEQPTDVTVEKPALQGRMHVVLGVGEAMMVSVLGRPPQHAALRAALRQHGQHELHEAARGERPVREIAVVAGAYAEHPNTIEHAAQRQGAQAHARPDRGEAAQMGGQERYRRRIDDVPMPGGAGGS